MRKLFVSYARENKPDVDQLVEHLRTMGYDTWVDAALRGGQDWWDEILDRIADTDAVIAIYSAAALNSTACAREFEWASALGKPVIPVAVETPPSAMPSRFARRQIIDYSEPALRDRAALQLQGALASLPPTPPLPDQLPDPPAAPLSYLTDIVDLITQQAPLDHDQQHQILLQLEPALTSADPLERRGGRDTLERFSRRNDIYRDVDQTITRLLNLNDLVVATGPSTLADNPNPLSLKPQREPPHPHMDTEVSEPETPHTLTAEPTPPARQRTTLPRPSQARRIGAFVIDVIPIVIVYGIAYGIMVGFPGHECHSWTYPTDNVEWTACQRHPSVIGNAALVIAGLIALGYGIWNWVNRRNSKGSTVGQSVLKAKMIPAEVGQLPEPRRKKFVAALIVVLAVATVGTWFAADKGEPAGYEMCFNSATQMYTEYPKAGY